VSVPDAGSRVHRLGGLELDGAPRIMVPFVAAVDAARVAAARAAGMDAAELRLDRWPELHPDELVGRTAAFSGVPTLATIRSAAEGGGWTGSDAARAALFQAAAAVADGVDIELSSAAILGDVVGAARAERRLVVVSFHDFEATPTLGALRDIAAAAREAGADIVKVACMPTDPACLRRLAAFTLEQAEAGVVAIAMGTAGLSSRLLFPALGSAFTFASFGEGSAPGQIDVTEMRALIARIYG
jgi:3-dehydroquinate dehydratase-1